MMFLRPVLFLALSVLATASSQRKPPDNLVLDPNPPGNLSSQSFSRLGSSVSSTAGTTTDPNTIHRLKPLRHIQTDLLNITYYEAGPVQGTTVVLLHGWPYDIHSYIEVAPALAAQGYRVIVPYLRGNGPTTFLYEHTFRSGDQAAFGTDVISLLDALNITKAIFAGFDWGSRAACVAAALWPERCAGLVSVNSYAINDIATLGDLDQPSIEAGFWYFYYFLTSRGRRVLSNNAKEIARVVWTKNSPAWNFTEADLDRTSNTYDNPAYVDVVLHVYRNGLGYAAGDPAYAKTQAQLLENPVITVPAVTLDGLDDGNFPATNGSSTAKYFTGPRLHHQVPNAGHNLPQENPKAFIDAVIEVTTLR